MNRNTYRFFLLVLPLFLANRMFSQDLHFSQYIETPSSLNPALLGFTYDTRIIANNRTQWAYAARKPYQTYGVAYDGGTGKKLKGNRFGWGLSIVKDIAGDARFSSLLPTLGFSYSLKIDKTSRFGMGAQYGLNYRTIDISNLRWGAQYVNYEYNPISNNGETTPRSSVLSNDIGAGVHYSYSQSEKYISAKDGNKFDIGFAAYHFRMPKSSFLITSEKLMTRYIFYANGEFYIPNMRFALVPSMIFMRQGTNSAFVTGMMFKYVLVEESKFTSIKKPSAVSLGASYRYRDAIIPMFLWQYDVYGIGISYDINLSPLTPASRLKGGLEIMLRYNLATGYGKNLGRTDTKASY